MKQADKQRLLASHPEIRMKLEIINFFDDFGLRPTRRADKKGRSTIFGNGSIVNQENLV